MRLQVKEEVQLVSTRNENTESKDRSNDLNAFDAVYNSILQIEKQYSNKKRIETVNDCIRLENLLQYFKDDILEALRRDELPDCAEETVIIKNRSCFR